MKRVLMTGAVVAVIVFGAIALWTQRAEQPPHHPGTPVEGEVPRFKFVVIGDLTGGRHSEGTVFTEAIREINLIDPDFVISVGDLIEGYSDSPEQVEAEWDAFEDEIGELNRPFYYVFGNHDATTPVMIDIARDRYKNLYYSFDHRRCHFIVLFSETRNEEGMHQGLVGDRRQIAWLKRDLALHADAVHTFVFFHRPEISPEIENLFAERPTTVFTGHHHIYRQFTEGSINTHTLGSTGGRMHEDLYSGGLFHYMLVTVSGEKVTPAIVRVGAILPNDFLSVDQQDKIAAARAAVQNVSLALPEATRPVDGTLEIEIPNPLPMPIRVTCGWLVKPGTAWTVDPAETELIVEADSVKTVTFRLKTDRPVKPTDEDLPEFRIHALGGRALTAHTPTEKGLDVLYDFTTPLRLTK